MKTKKTGADSKSDPENPTWAKADFATAQGPDLLPAAMLAAFLKTGLRRGRPPKPR